MVCKPVGGSLAGCGGFSMNRDFGGFSSSQFNINEVVFFVFFFSSVDDVS